MTKACIAAVEYCLPENALGNAELAALFPEWSEEKIESKLGIINRPIAAQRELSSDLAVRAAQKLFATGVCSPSEIDFVLFCTQSPDYFLPTTACLIQDRLGIPKTAGALDFNLGCSGWVYGLGMAKGLIETGQARKLLLLTGETYSKFLSPFDKGTRTVFGDAGAATLVSGIQSETDLIGPFTYGTDGSGGEHLILRRGGMRNPGQPVDDSEGLCMNGGEIFSFSVREVSRAVSGLLEKASLSIEDADLFIFHQANGYMLDFLQKKCRIPEEKFYKWFREVGNTVSNTIPIALHHALSENRVGPGQKVVFAGFGVGLSWAACLAEIPPGVMATSPDAPLKPRGEHP